MSDDKGAITYSQMNERADRLAAGLAEHSIARGDHVGLYLMNGPEYLESFFAIIKLGAVPFNVNYRYTADELLYLFGNADAKCVIHGAEFSEIVKKLKAELPDLSVSVAVDDGQGGDPTRSNSLAYEDLMQTASANSRYERSEDDYMLQYTGGTTGMPKGVMWPHKAFFFACLGGGGMYLRQPPIKNPEEIAEMAVNGPPLRVLPVAPLMHGAAIWTALSGILGGVTMVLDPMRSGFDPEGIWDRVEREQVNVLQIVGDAMAVPLLNSLKAHPKRWDLSRLVHFGSGGAVFSKHIKEALKKHLPFTMMADGMGTSETGISGMSEPATDGGYMRLPSDEFQQVIVGDRIGEIGEIGYLSRTGNTPIGYYNDPVKSPEIFKEIDGMTWVMTGDQARLDADGMITVLGRGSTCINSGGEKIYPEEVEEVLRAHPAIHDAVVVGMPDEKWGQTVSAVVSLSSGTDVPDLDELKDFCRGDLAGYKLPRRLKIVEEISRSPAGKQDYKWAKTVLEGTN